VALPRLWREANFRMLGGGAQRWHAQLSKRVLDLSSGATRPPDGIYRIEIDDPDGDAWITTTDYRRLVRLRTRVREPKPSVFSARFIPEDARSCDWAATGQSVYRMEYNGHQFDVANMWRRAGKILISRYLK
jgi:hypothetical protein